MDIAFIVGMVNTVQVISYGLMVIYGSWLNFCEEMPFLLLQTTLQCRLGAFSQGFNARHVDFLLAIKGSHNFALSLMIFIYGIHKGNGSYAMFWVTQGPQKPKNVRARWWANWKNCHECQPLRKCGENSGRSPEEIQQKQQDLQSMKELILPYYSASCDQALLTINSAHTHELPSLLQDEDVAILTPLSR